MQTQLIKSITFFQQLLSSQFSTLNQRLVDTLVFLSTCHLFGLTNPNQVADALSIPKARLYRELNTMSLYLWQHLFVRIGCSIALEAIRKVVSKSASTLSRLCIVISVDDTFVFRYGTDILHIQLVVFSSQATDEGAKYIGDHTKDWRPDHSPEYATD